MSTLVKNSYCAIYGLIEGYALKVTCFNFHIILESRPYYKLLDIQIKTGLLL